MPRPSGSPDGRAGLLRACPGRSRTPNAPFHEPFRLHRETRRVRILVVDDEPAVRSAITRALTLDGYEVAAADDGPSALGAVQRERPELVVLDVLMPELDGIAVCRRLRGDGDCHRDGGDERQTGPQAHALTARAGRSRRRGPSG